MSNNSFKKDLYNRLLNLTIQTINLLNDSKFPYTLKDIRSQLIRSIGSVGANFSEGNGASSKAEFAQFINYSKKSAIESIYWFDVLRGINIFDQDIIKKIIQLRDETVEVRKILTSIYLKVGKVRKFQE